MHHATSILVLLGSLTGSVLAATPDAVAWSCVATQSVGFALDPKTHRWTPARPKPRHYVIRAPERGPAAPLIGQDSVLVVVEPGDSDWSNARFCKSGFDAGGTLHCEGWGDDFYFNRDNGRFLHAFAHGYVEGPDNPFGAEGEAPPFIELGTCTVLKHP